MRKFIFLVILGAIGYMIYINTRVPENVRIQNAISRRWFSKVTNRTPELINIISHFEVDTDLSTRVYLTRQYDMLSDNQMGFLSGVVLLIRQESSKPEAGITFILNDRTVAVKAAGDRKAAINIVR